MLVNLKILLSTISGERKYMLRNVKKVLRIPIRFHWSALLLLLLFGWNFGILYGGIFFALVILSTIFHEQGHALIAERNGIEAYKIVIFALGAAVFLDPIGFVNNPKKELKCAIAGPIASLILAILFMIPILIYPYRNIFTTMCSYMFVVNLVMCLFNLIPCYPMDGGKVLNPLLSMKLGVVRAINISSIISYVLSGGLLLLCVYYKLYWMVITFAFIIIFAYLQRKQVLRNYWGG